jgi:metallo-beta-lactamase class B
MMFLLFVVSSIWAQGQGGGERVNWNNRGPWGTTRRDAPMSEQKIQPFKVFDNLYYVGTHTVSSYLVTTSDGLVLIDSTFTETGDALVNGIRSIGFDPANIKYVLVTHSHDDHYGGARAVKRVSTARVAMSAEDWEVVERAERSPQEGGQTAVALTRDVVLKEGQDLRVGDTVFKFYFTPGHTPGATSIEFQVRDGSRSYRTVIPGGLGLTFRPEQNATFLKSISRLKELGPWDVALGNHPFLAPRDIEEIKKDLATRGQGAHPGVVGSAKIGEWFDAITTTVKEKDAFEKQGGR